MPSGPGPRGAPGLQEYAPPADAAVVPAAAAAVVRAAAAAVLGPCGAP